MHAHAGQTKHRLSIVRGPDADGEIEESWFALRVRLSSGPRAAVLLGYLTDERAALALARRIRSRMAAEVTIGPSERPEGAHAVWQILLRRLEDRLEMEPVALIPPGHAPERAPARSAVVSERPGEALVEVRRFPDDWASWDFARLVPDVEGLRDTVSVDRIQRLASESEAGIAGIGRTMRPPLGARTQVSTSSLREIVLRQIGGAAIHTVIATGAGRQALLDAAPAYGLEVIREADVRPGEPYWTLPETCGSCDGGIGSPGQKIRL